MRSFRALACVVAVLVFAGCDWAQLGFDSSNTSANPYEPAMTPTSVAHLSVAWSQPCRCGRPLASRGVVYDLDDSVSGTTSVRAFDAARGTPKWSRPFAVSPPFTEVRLMAVADGLVYLIVTRSVVALDAGTGMIRWTVVPPAPGTGTIRLAHLLVDESGFPIGGPESTTAFVDVTAAISNANPVSEISAIDGTGHIRWSTSPGGESAGFAGVRANDQPDSTAHDLDVVSVLTSSQPAVTVLSQYDEGSGFLLHQAVVGPGAPATAFAPFDDVSAANGLVHFVATADLGSNTQGIFAIDPTNGAVVWSGLGNRPYAVAPRILVSVLDTHLFLTSIQGLDSRTGRVVWRVPGGSEPAVAGPLVFDSVGGVVEALDLETGAVLGTFSVANDSLGAVTPSNGLVYAGSSQHLYALAPNTT